MDPQQLFHERALHPVAAAEIREPRNQVAKLAEPVGIAEHPIAQPNSRFLGGDRLGALHQAWKIELELVTVARRVRASSSHILQR